MPPLTARGEPSVSLFLHIVHLLLPHPINVKFRSAHIPTLGTPQLRVKGAACAERPAPRALVHPPRSSVTGFTRPVRGGTTGSPKAQRNTASVKPFTPGGHDAAAGSRAGNRGCRVGGTSERPAFSRTSASSRCPPFAPRHGPRRQGHCIELRTGLVTSPTQKGAWSPDFPLPHALLRRQCRRSPAQPGHC